MSTRSDPRIPLSVPHLAANEWRYVKECLDSGWVSTAGPYVRRFEEAVAGYLGAAHAVATVSGTAALHVALQVAGVEPGDEVLCSTLTFVAPANAIRYLGAWPVLMDADPVYWQMDPEKTVAFLERECHWQQGRLVNRHTGRRVRAILPVDILGHPVDLDPILEVARKYELAVVEDATESLGAEYRGRKTGRLGDIACFSFNGNKIITTGGGGMIVTDNARWAERARYLTTQAKDDPVEYIHGEIGYNYRLTSIQAAVGVAQLEQLPGFVERKRWIAGQYAQGLAGLPGITLPAEAAWARSTFWLYTILVDEERAGVSSRTLLRQLEAVGIQARPFWCPVHRQRPHAGAFADRIEVADRLYAQGLSLPSSVSLTEAEVRSVAAAVRAAVGD